MKKRVTSFILAFVLIFTTVVTGINVRAAETDEKWTEPTKNEDTYEVKTAEELVWLANEVNQGHCKDGINIKLMNDIDLSSVCGPDKGNWVPIGKSGNYGDDRYFVGTFDGQGYTVSNLYIDNKGTVEDIISNPDPSHGIGFIGAVSDATVKNVTVTGTINVDGNEVAGLVGYVSMTSEKSIIVENCHVDMDITGRNNTGSNVNGVGGVVGVTRANCNISNCSYEGNLITRQSNTGGILAYAEVETTVDSCANKGTITKITGGSNGNYAAGVVGEVGPFATLNISNCYNVGNVISEGDGTDTYTLCIGGIIGAFQCDPVNSIHADVTMTNCYSTGKVIAEGKYTAAGSIVGDTDNHDLAEKFQNNYYLANLAEDTTGSVAKTADELKGLTETLGEKYKKDTGINHGYPILAWEKAEYVAVSDIKLDKTESLIYDDGTEQLTATLSPANATYREITWTSSDESIATVTKRGLVKPVSTGEVVITATAEDKKAECKITIKPVVHVTEVTLDQSELYFFANNNKIADLTATVSPANASYPTVTWKSSNEKVAMVTNKGRLLAYSVGTAVITATAEGKSAQCVVNVVPEDGDSSGYYADYLFTSAKTEGGVDLLGIETGEISNWSGTKPRYTITIPEGTEKVNITFPKGTDIGGQACLHEDGNVGYNSVEGDISRVTNDDGTITLTIKTKDYTDTKRGVALQNGMWYPVCGFDFVTGTPTDLTDTYKKAATAELKNYKDFANYRKEQVEELESILAKAFDGEIASMQDAVKAYEAAKKAMDDVKTNAQLLKEEKAAAKEKITEYVNSKDALDYREEQQKELQTALEEAKKAIEAAKTAEDVEQALANAKKSVAAVKTSAVLKAEEAQEAAEKALKEAEEAKKNAEANNQEAEAKINALKNVVALTASKVRKVTVKSQSGNAVTFTWTAVENADNYLVKILKNGKTVDTINTTATTYTYKNAPAGYAYTAVVTPTITYEGVKYAGLEAKAAVTKQLAAPSIKVKKSGSKVKITAKKRSCTGYQVQISKKSTFSSKKNYRVKGKTLSKSVKVSALNKGKNYVRVRAYTTYNGKTVYSKWSKTKTVKK